MKLSLFQTQLTPSRNIPLGIFPLPLLNQRAQRKKLGKKETPLKEFRRLRTATNARALDRGRFLKKATQKLSIRFTLPNR